MNTLNKKYTQNFFVNEDGYAILKKRWSDLHQTSELKNFSSSHFLFYSVLMGKDYRKAFFPGRKMQDYMCPQGLWDAIMTYRHYRAIEFFNTHFGDLLVKGWETKVRKIIPQVYRSGLDTYAQDAYSDEAVLEHLFNVTQSEEVKPAQSLINRIKNVFIQA